MVKRSMLQSYLLRVNPPPPQATSVPLHIGLCRCTSQREQTDQASSTIYQVLEGKAAFGRPDAITWIDLTIGSNAIGIYDVLKPSGELVCLVVCGWRLVGLHPIQDGGDSRSTMLLLHTNTLEVREISLLWSRNQDPLITTRFSLSFRKLL